MQRYLRSDLDVVELGSSLGVVSSHIARKIGSSRRLICVEANSSLIEILKTNVILNRPGITLSIINAAVCYDCPSDGLASFEIQDDTTGSRLGGHDGEALKVPVVRLDSIIMDHHIQQYSLVCDIEGAEMALVMESSDALRLCQQVIIEYHEAAWNGERIGPGEFVRRLEEKHGFHIVDQHGPVYVFERAAYN